MMTLSSFVVVWSHLLPFTTALLFVLFMFILGKWKTDTSKKALLVFWSFFCILFFLWIFYEKYTFASPYPVFDFYYILYKLLLVPLFYNYIYAVTKGRFLSKKYWLLFYTPIAILVFIYFIIILYWGKEPPVFSIGDFFASIEQPYSMVRLLVLVCYIIDVVVILMLSVKHYVMYNRYVAINFSDKSYIRQDFLLLVLALYCLNVIFSVISCVNSGVFIHVSVHYIIALLNVSLAFFAYSHTNPYVEKFVPLLHLQPELTEKPVDLVQYEKMLKTLTRLCEQDQIWRNSNLSATDVISYLNTNRTYFSKFLQDVYKTNFRTCVNTYRINEAQRLLRENFDISIVDLYLQCGFYSSSSFNEWFKRITGKSPSEYKEQLQE